MREASIEKALKNWSGMTCSGITSKDFKPLTSKLSDILELNAPQKYYLSPKACQGILRRAEKRGKELPPLLKAALEAQAEGKLLVTNSLSLIPQNWDGKQIAPTLTRQNANGSQRMPDKENFNCVLSPVKAEILDMTHANDAIRECGNVVPTLQARMGTGGNQIPLVFEPTYCIQGNTIDRSDTAGANGKGVIEGKSYTLNTVDRPAVAYAVGIQPNNSTSAGGLSDIGEKSPTLSVTKLAGVCYARSGFGEFVDSEMAGTLRASAAEHGVSSQDVIAQAVAYNGENITSPQNASNPQIGDPCHTLGATGANRSLVGICYPINTQIVTRSNKLGEGTGMGIGEDGDPAYTLQEAHSHGVICAIDRAAFNQGENSNSNNDYCYQKTVGALCARDYKGVGSQYVSEDKLVCEPKNNQELYVWIVRRLTPLECERLQGFPDKWTQYDTKGNEIKDTPRYKACGNSIAIPCAVRVFQGIVEAEKRSVK